MTPDEIKYVETCIREDVHRFYIWSKWQQARREALKIDKAECQICKARGVYTKATTVHHINYVKTHPELALEMWYEWRGKVRRNLISLCFDCHEEAHGYRKIKKNEPLTEERWD